LKTLERFKDFMDPVEYREHVRKLRVTLAALKKGETSSDLPE